jgi:YD repeat-containing protein
LHVLFAFTEELPVATYTYNGDGDLLTASDGDDHTTTYTYNDMNELTSVKNGDGDTTDYTTPTATAPAWTTAWADWSATRTTQ